MMDSLQNSGEQRIPGSKVLSRLFGHPVPCSDPSLDFLSPHFDAVKALAANRTFHFPKILLRFSLL